MKKYDNQETILMSLTLESAVKRGKNVRSECQRTVYPEKVEYRPDRREKTDLVTCTEKMNGSRVSVLRNGVYIATTLTENRYNAKMTVNDE